MRNYLNSSVVAVASFLLFPLMLMAQKGPAGVSVETTGPQDSNCKLWYDMSSLNFGDGDRVDTLIDISLSANNNIAYQDTLTYQPIYRTGSSAGFYGRPALSFGTANPNSFMLLNSSEDINLQDTTTARTMFVNFRTGDDVTTRQMIYEQGGNERGINVHIHNDSIYVNTYDLLVDGDGTPAFGPIYVSNKVQRNWNYTVTLVYEGSVGNLTGTIRAYLNGTPFSSGVAGGVGSLAEHIGEPCIGGVNGRAVMHDGYVADAIGSPNTDRFSFKGLMGEYISYSEALPEAHRVIIENYLGAKYLTGTWNNIVYDYQNGYAEEVFGIGQLNGQYHNISQGSGIFEISGSPANFNDGEFLLIGHDNADLSASTVNIPNNSSNTQRVSRTWRVDHTGNMGAVTIRVEASELPALGAGFNKYVLMLDNKGGLTPKFAGSNVEVIELVDEGNGYYSTTTNLTDGSYLTFGIIKPQVSFTAATAYGFELNTNSTEQVSVELNYTPATAVNFNYTFNSNTATNPADYIASNGFVTFSAGSSSTNISFDIVGDAIGESSETFSIVLAPGANTTAGHTTGSLGNMVYSIYDNDNDPEVSFAVSSATISEDADSIQVDIVRAGNTAIAFSVDCHLRTSGSVGTATQNVDYIITSPQTINFAAGEVLKQVTIYLTDDATDEDDETVYLELSNVVGLVDLVASTEYELTIADDDVPPTISFQNALYFAPEIFDEPEILIVLDQPTSKDVQVEYQINTGTSTATSVSDYNSLLSGTVVIPAGDSSVRLPLYVVQDGVAEPDETVEIDLLNNANLLNATFGAQSHHTFTIKDYLSYEWTGPAGVALYSEVPAWYDATADAEVYSNGQAVPVMNNQGTDYITAYKHGTADMIMNSTSGTTINGRPAYQFGTNVMYKIDDYDILTGAADNRDIFMVIRTGSSVSGTQIIYDGGGKQNGHGIYIKNGNIYFNIHTLSEGWGNSAPGGIATYASAPVAPNTNYIVQAHFDHQLIYGDNKIELYLNGTLMGTNNDANVVQQGGMVHSILGHGENILLHDNTFTEGDFLGVMGEFIAFQNAPLTKARRELITNYLSAKYAIAIPSPIHNAASLTGFGNYGAGLISLGTDGEHLDAQGPAAVRMNNVSSIDSTEYLFWHYNGASMADSITTLLPTNMDSRVARVWAVSESGDVGTVKVTFDLDDVDMSNKTVTDLELLIHSNANPDDFSNATRHVAGRTLNGSKVSFTNVEFNDGDFFTLSLSPGDCIDGLWTGAIDNDWNNPNNWDCGTIPTSTTDVVIPTGTPNYPILNAGVTYPVKGVTVDAGAQISNASIAAITPAIEVYGDLSNQGTISGSVTISMVGSTAQSISGDLNLNIFEVDNANGVTINSGDVEVAQALNLKSGTLYTGGNITMLSTVSKTAYINDFESGYSGSISGDITIQRSITSVVSGFHYLGFGLTNATIDQIDDNAAITTYNGASNGSQVTPNGSCSFTELAPGSFYGNLFDYRENTVTNCELSGWHIRTTGAINTAQGLAFEVPSGTIIDQTGTYQTGSVVSTALKYTGSNNSGKRGRNLLANPYHSDLNWGDVVSSPSNSNITGEAFVFVTSGSYAGTFTTYNLANNADLAPGQGFFVIATANNATVTFDNNMRRGSSSTFYRTGNQFEKKMELHVTGNGLADVTTLLFDADFTTDFDRLYDGRKMMSANGINTLYTLTDAVTGMQSINALPNDGSVTNVPVGFNVGTTGTYTISANMISGFGASALVLLEDTKLGTMHILSANDYTFSATTTDNADRFVLHFVPEADVLVNDVDCQGANGSIKVNLTEPSINGTGFVWDNISVQDPSGAVLSSVSQVSGAVFNGNDLNAGTYTVTFNYNNYTVVETVELSAKEMVSTNMNLSATTVTVGEPVELIGNVTGATSINWNLGDGSTNQGQLQFTHSYLTEGVYTIELNASNNDCASSTTKQVTVNKQGDVTSVNDMEDASIELYANGRTVYINFVNVTTNDKASFKAYNLVGQLVMDAVTVDPSGKQTIQLSDELADGAYIISLEHNGDKQTKMIYIGK